MMTLWLWFLWSSGIVEAFITVPLDYNDPTIKKAFCPTRPMSTSPKYSKYLTREAIRREVRKMMMEEPPAGDTEFSIPEDATLLYMYRKYYGESASPLRFFKAINSIAWSNAEVDTSPNTKYDPRYHFDAEHIQSGQDLLASRHSYIVSAVIKDQAYHYARDLIGTSLHSIQDFYSHTTWVELGNIDILEDLGIPGLKIDAAGPNDENCRTCGKSKDGCLSNVISFAKLTSGFIEFSSYNGILNTSKPQQSGKCSFGGSFDESRAKHPTGGINKASPSSCFSPHHSLHEDAASLAIKASESYLSTIRYTIGNDHFRKLLDIYNGSALVVVMDTTGSMSGEIQGVKEEVKKIVRIINPEVYILVPFSDPDFGPADKVGDGAEFIRLLELLKADGGDDIPEMSWSGLQLALSVTPEYSTLYLFTDAPGKDEHLFKSVLLLAQAKHITITVVYTAAGPSDFYRQITELTGGALIDVGKENFDTSVPIIEAGVEQNKAIVDRRTFSNDSEHLYEFPVDDTINELKLTVEGKVLQMDLKTPSGTTYSLMNPSTSSGDFTKETYSDELTAFIFQRPEKGMWKATVKGTGTYHIATEASSLLDVLVEMVTFDPLPPRPGYFRLTGRPLQGSEYYVEVVLIGWLESEVKDLTAMKFLGMDGEIIREIEYDGEIRNEVFIKTGRIDDEPFTLSFTGHLKSGRTFTRIFPTIITPVSVKVELPSSSKNITGVAGSKVNITVLVTNQGDIDDFKNKAINSKGYEFDDAVFDEVEIKQNETRAMLITVQIPEDEADWSVSELVITSASESKDSNVNSQVSYIMVVPKDKDVIEPKCTSSNEPDCGTYNRADNCHLSNWSVSAVLQDEDSGLSYVYPQPNRNSIWFSTPKLPALNNPVNVSMVSSCCNRKISIIGIDEQGNIGRCEYNMGQMDGVFSFEIEDRSSTWVYLKWEVKSLREDLSHYVLHVKYGYEQKDFYGVNCFDLTCYYNVTQLVPCTMHTFVLMPTYNQKTHKLTGSPSTVSTYTLNAEPDAPLNVKLNQTGNEIYVRWDSPQLKACVEEYKVCFRKTGEDEPVCYRLASPNFALDVGKAQSLALSSLSSIGRSGKENYFQCGKNKCADDKKGALPCLCFNAGSFLIPSWITSFIAVLYICSSILSR